MKVYLSDNAWTKLCAYVDNCELEIGGLGKITTDGKDFFVSDVEIFTQTVTSAFVNLSAETLAQFQVEKMKAKESLVDYKFAWHSHAKMGVFWSQTDKDTMDGSTEFPWLVSLVINHKHEMLARLDIFKPVHVHLDAVPVEIYREVDQTIVDACIADIAAKVTKPAPYLGYGRNALPGKKSGAMSDLLEREYSVYDTTPANVKTARLNALSEKLVQLEDEYETLTGQPKNKKTDKKLEKLTKDMDNIAYQLDMLAI